jgi:hypothetical protein
MTTFSFTTFDTALQAKLNSASVNLSAQDYLLLAKAVQTALDTTNGISLLSLKGTANGVAGLDSTGQVPGSQLLNAIASQISNSGKFLTTNGTTTAWTDTATLATISTSGKAYIGSGAQVFDTSAELTSTAAVFNVASSADSYGQISIHNSSATSSTDVIAYANNGTDSAGWIDMGITGATFNSATYGITGPHDGYIFMSAPVGTTGSGNLVIATGDNGTDNKIVFAAGGYSSGSTQMEITPDENIHIEIDTPSTSPTTGALTIVGGVGIQGDVNIDGTITFGGAGTTVETSNLAVSDPLIFTGNVNQGDALDLGFVGEYANSISTITKTVSNKALTSNVATLTTSDTHGFAIGDIAVVTGVDATFNGTHYVTGVPTTTTFTFAKENANVTSAVATGSVSVSLKRKFAAVSRDASDGVIKFIKDITTKPTSTINFSEAGSSYATIKVGGAEIGSVTNTEIGYLSGVTSAIQTQLDVKAVYPTQTSNSGKYLTTNGTITSWATVDALPAQANNSGKYLTTDGTSATWAVITTDPMPQIFMMMGA